MKKIHRYHIEFYTSGGFLKSVTVEANTKAEAIAKVRKEHYVVEMYCVKYIN